MVKVTLPDNSVREYEDGIKVIDVAKDISEGLARATYGAYINGDTTTIQDIRTPINEDAKLELITDKNPAALEVLRHTAAHIMAQAVQRLYPGTKYAIGPTVENGFYYDFDTPEPFRVEDFAKIEAEMKKIIKEGLEIERSEMNADSAIEYFKEKGDKYKVELIEDLKKNQGVKTVSLYTQGDFTDLCRGPHARKTSSLKKNAFKLMRVSGSYWRGDSSREQLQRIYGTAWFSKSDLDAHLNWLEESEKRDHRKIGKELDLFSFQEQGPGFPFWHPKGTVLFDELSKFINNECFKRDYAQIRTPMILNEELWHTSGHWDHFKNNMYFTKIDEQDFAVKPMNCPGCVLIYKSDMHSYRELPLKYAELGLVHRHELSGVLHGLFRVRSFTQDDAHVFCTKEQLPDEIIKLIDFTMDVYKAFGFEKYEIFIATRPEDAMGSEEDWELATKSLMNALEKMNIPFKIKEGEGAFYGPKIEFNIKDCLNRNWQCGTIQVDFSMPVRFDISYEGSDGNKHRPVMVHRAILGSLERFIGILTEHFEGKYPTWIAPTQVQIIPVSDNFIEYSDKVYNKLKSLNIRVERDYKSETLKYKIRQAQLLKIPYMLIIGQQEEEAELVSVRMRDEGGKDVGQMKLEAFCDKLIAEIDNKNINLTITGE